jgi:germination protein M
MIRRFVTPLAVVALAASMAACTAGSGGLGPVPTPPASPAASVTQPSSDTTPTLPSPTPSDSADASPTASSTAPASPSPSPAGTMIVRAYFLLADGPTGGGGLVPVLVEVPETKAVARAAMTALLDGSSHLRDASQTISSAIPPGTDLLGIDITDGVATVDLSGEFETGGGSASVFGRLGQVVYTLTQFPTVSSVRFHVDGRAVDAFSSEGVLLDHPLTRADFEDQLPAIFVDRPAWGAAIGNPARVMGNANVFEAQFRVAIIAGDGTVLADTAAHATCGTGCRGTFDVTIPYTVANPGWGTLRVYDPSEKDGSPQEIREYPVYLTAP